MSITNIRQQNSMIWTWFQYKEPLLMIITTAGIRFIRPIRAMYRNTIIALKCRLDPNVDTENEEYFIDILEVDTEDYEDIGNIQNERLWWKANPIRMSYENGRDKIRGAYEIAKEIPEKMTAFLTKMLNIWVQAKRKRIHGHGEMESMPGRQDSNRHERYECLCRIRYVCKN